jgi:hypothetical protein
MRCDDLRCVEMPHHRPPRMRACACRCVLRRVQVVSGVLLVVGSTCMFNMRAVKPSGHAPPELRVPSLDASATEGEVEPLRSACEEGHEFSPIIRPDFTARIDETGHNFGHPGAGPSQASPREDECVRRPSGSPRTQLPPAVDPLSNAVNGGDVRFEVSSQTRQAGCCAGERSDRLL